MTICYGLNELTHCGLVSPYDDIELSQPWGQVMVCFLAVPTITWTDVD